MSLDIIIFAIVAAVLVARLRAILGERHGEERKRPNPFDPKKAVRDQKADVVTPLHDVDAKDTVTAPMVISDDLIKSEDPEAAKAGLKAIAAADHSFDVREFLDGARGAFGMVTDAFADGDRETLKMLLSDDLYQGFERVLNERESRELTAEYQLHRMKDARVADARLGGVMAYVTVDFDVEQTSIVRDKDGKVIEGDADKITEVHDVWTFARDTRADDPNWELVSTRMGDG
jgi:predicted lipid-binding transport protein (Tim44 family)